MNADERRSIGDWKTSPVDASALTCVHLRLPLILLALATCGSCQRDIGRGGTGELVVHRSVLREVQSLEPEQFSTNQPTTYPSTLPTTRSAAPPQETALTIVDARQLALRNNLDLRVDLFNPSIAREGINQEE